MVLSETNQEKLVLNVTEKGLQVKCGGCSVFLSSYSQHYIVSMLHSTSNLRIACRTGGLARGGAERETRYTRVERESKKISGATRLWPRSPFV